MLSVNFAKFLRTTFLTAHLRRLFLYVHSGNFKLNAGYTDSIKMLSTKRYYQQNEWWKEKITVCTKYFFLHNALRRFYTRRNVSGMSQWHRFFFFFWLLHMRSSFVYRHFPEISILVKSTNNFNFSASDKCRFLFKQIIFEYSFKQVSHCNMAYSQSLIELKMKMTEYPIWTTMKHQRAFR